MHNVWPNLSFLLGDNICSTQFYCVCCLRSPGLSPAGWDRTWLNCSQHSFSHFPCDPHRNKNLGSSQTMETGDRPRDMEGEVWLEFWYQSLETTQSVIWSCLGCYWIKVWRTLITLNLSTTCALFSPLCRVYEIFKPLRSSLTACSNKTLILRFIGFTRETSFYDPCLDWKVLENCQKSQWSIANCQALAPNP